jgi:hypothetical protein
MSISEYTNFRVANIEDVRPALQRDGCVVFNVLTPAEVDDALEGMWNCLGRLSTNLPTPIVKEDHTTFKSFFDLYPSHATLLAHW